MQVRREKHINRLNEHGQIETVVSEEIVEMPDVDTPEENAIVRAAEQAAAEAQAAEALAIAAELDEVKPDFQALAQAARAALAADETERASDVDKLASAGSLATVKPIVSRMLAREQLQIRALDRLIRLAAGLAGIRTGQNAGLKAPKP